MCPKIRCDGESEKFCKIFWELNRALDCLGLENRDGHFVAVEGGSSFIRSVMAGCALSCFQQAGRGILASSDL
jgi:hypothetical protein